MRYSILPFVFASLLAAGSSATTYVVNPEGTGDFPTIQAAVDAVLLGDVIELTDGVFTGDGNRDITFNGKDLTVRSQSGDPEVCVIDCEGSLSDQHRGFYFDYGETPASVVEGIAIRNGYIDGAFGGAGVYCSHSSSPTIVNCVIENNRADVGAGIHSRYTESLTVIGCTIRDNFPGDGLRCNDCGVVSLCDCMFLDNDGGGLGCSSCGIATLHDCTIRNNGDRGGMSCGSSTVELVNCTFEGNDAGVGGGMGCVSSTVELVDCTFDGNDAQADGGGVYCFESALRAEGCTFSDNWVQATGWPRSRGAGMLCAYGSIAELTNCTFQNNTMNFFTEVAYGGGLYCRESSVTVAGCTFDGNEALYGGAVGCEGCSPSFINCTLVRNSVPYSGAGVFCDEASPVLQNVLIAFNLNGSAVTCMGSSFPELYCCDIYGNGGGDWIGCIEGQLGINGNIWEDPLFCNFGAGDFRLQETSPCAPFSPPNPECDLIGAWPVGCWSDVHEGTRTRAGRYLALSVPNPFSPPLRVTYKIPEDRGPLHVVCGVLDPAGRLVRTLEEQLRPAGMHVLAWDGVDLRGRPVESGVYYLKLTTGAETLTKPIVVIR